MDFFIYIGLHHLVPSDSPHKSMFHSFWPVNRFTTPSGPLGFHLVPSDSPHKTMFHSFWVANSLVWDKPEKSNGTRGRIEAYIYKQSPLNVLTVQTNSSSSYECFIPKNPWMFGFQSSANGGSRSDARISLVPSVLMTSFHESLSQLCKGNNSDSSLDMRKNLMQYYHDLHKSLQSW